MAENGTAWDAADLDAVGLYEMAWEEPADRPAGEWGLCVVGGDGAALAPGAAGAGERCDVATLEEAIAALTGRPGAWQVVIAAEAGAEPADPAGIAAGVHAATQRALAAVQTWLRADDLAGRAVLAFVTRRAVTVPGDKAFALAHSGLWGLVRSAQTEAPGRIRIVDHDGGPAADPAVLAAALRRPEPQLAVRADRVLLPQLVPCAAAGDPLPDFAAGAVVITGGTGTLGRELARHLAVTHGARRLALVSRRGEQAPGVAELRAELAAIGATVQAVAADVTEPADVRRALAEVRARGPIVGVAHATGVLDNVPVALMTPDQLTALLRSKVDSALLMDAATRDDDLRFFTIFSSLSGVLGGPAQGNYAAANTFLDQFAAWRRAAGRPATAVAWGLWGEASGMTEHLDEAALLMLRRMGVAPFSTAGGLGVHDAALTGTGSAAVVGTLLAFPDPTLPDEPPAPFLLTRLNAEYARRHPTD